MMESDAELEQALYAAFAREAAPATLMAGVEGRMGANFGAMEPALAGVDGRVFIPTFAGLEITTQSRWTSMLSLGAHALICALIVLFALDQWHTREVQKKLIATVDVMPFIPAANLKDTMGGAGAAEPRCWRHQRASCRNSRSSRSRHRRFCGWIIRSLRWSRRS